jgi:SpoU rRNA methylase family enzyme
MIAAFIRIPCSSNDFSAGRINDISIRVHYDQRANNNAISKLGAGAANSGLGGVLDA